MRRRYRTTAQPLLDERLPLLAAPNSKWGWASVIVIGMIFVGIISFILRRNPHGKYMPLPPVDDKSYTLPIVAGNYTHLEEYQKLACLPAYEDKVRNISRVIERWTEAWGRLRMTPPLVVYSTRTLDLIPKAEEYSKTMDMSWLAIVDRNLTYSGALRDCARRAAPGHSNPHGNDITVIGNDEGVDGGGPMMRSRPEVNAADVKMCFHTLFMRENDPDNTFRLAMLLWTSAELESVAAYIESHGGDARDKKTGAELAETWCAKKLFDRKQHRPVLW